MKITDSNGKQITLYDWACNTALSQGQRGTILALTRLIEVLAPQPDNEQLEYILGKEHYKVDKRREVQIINKIEDALNKRVRCHDGIERILVNITEHTLTYKIEVYDVGNWFELTPTRRSQVIDEFLGAEVIE